MTAEEMAALHGRAVAGQGRGWSSGEIAALLDSAHVVAVTGAHGFALLRVAGGEAEILTIATDPAFRRRGLAREVLGRAETAARAREAGRIVLEVARDNAPARALYDSVGYRPVACREGYYVRADGRCVDALILEKTL